MPILAHGMPTAQKAGIGVVWLTRGITAADLETLAPTLLRGVRVLARPAKDRSMDQLAEAAKGPTTDQLKWDGARRGGSCEQISRSREGADDDGCRKSF